MLKRRERESIDRLRSNIQGRYGCENNLLVEKLNQIDNHK